MLKNWIKKIFELFDGSTVKGIKFRFWFAVFCAIIAIIVDCIYVASFYDYIPRKIPVVRDWNGITPLEMGHKQDFWFWEIERIIFLAVVLISGWIITLFNRKSLVLKRTFCLYAEIAMLVLSTSVGVSIVLLYMASGDKTVTVSNYYEIIIMIVWFLVYLIEYLFDCRKLRKQISQ